MPIDVHVNIDYEPMSMTRRLGIQVERSFIGFDLTGEDLTEARSDELCREYTERAVHEFTRSLERALYEQMSRVLDEARRPRIDGRRYGGSIPREMFRTHTEELMSMYSVGDIWMHQIMMTGSPKKEKPKKEKFYKWMKDMTKEYNTAQVKAVMIDSNMKVYEEGTTMKHCLWNDYEERIKKGKYLAFHVTPPKEICKSGITLGYKRDDSNGGWLFHMAKGKANSTQNDPRLDVIYEKITESLNKEVKKKKQERPQTHTITVRDTIFGV